MKYFRVWIAEDMNKLAAALSDNETPYAQMGECAFFARVSGNELNTLFQFTREHGSAIAIMNSFDQDDEPT